jgi:hypothetical protein
MKWLIVCNEDDKVKGNCTDSACSKHGEEECIKISGGKVRRKDTNRRENKSETS